VFATGPATDTAGNTGIPAVENTAISGENHACAWKTCARCRIRTLSDQRRSLRRQQSESKIRQNTKTLFLPTRVPVLRRLLTTLVIPVGVLLFAVSLLELSAANLPPRLQTIARRPEAIVNVGVGTILAAAALSWLLES
jgi:hypothetical protein